MNIDRELAMKMWKDIFGDVEWHSDCFGTVMNKDAYSKEPVIMKSPSNPNRKYDYSWNLDHIRPKSSYEDESDADELNNLEPMHRQNNLEKSDNYPHFTIGDKKYIIVKNDAGGYGIKNENGQRIDWKKDGKYYG